MSYRDCQELAHPRQYNVFMRLELNPPADSPKHIALWS